MNNSVRKCSSNILFDVFSCFILYQTTTEIASAFVVLEKLFSCGRAYHNGKLRRHLRHRRQQGISHEKREIPGRRPGMAGRAHSDAHHRIRDGGRRERRAGFLKQGGKTISAFIRQTGDGKCRPRFLRRSSGALINGNPSAKRRKSDKNQRNLIAQ